MGRGMWRRALVAATCVGMATIAAPAAAGPPFENHYAGSEVICSAEADGRFIELGASFTPQGDVEFGYGGVYDEASGLWVSGATGMLAEGEFAIDFTFVDDAEQPAGTLKLEGTAMPIGEPLDVSQRWRDGNQQGRQSGTVQDLVVTAEITSADGQLVGLPGTDLTCMGSQFDVTDWVTNPATRISQGTSAGGTCEFTEDGKDGIVSVEVWGDEGYGFLAWDIDWDAETAALIAEGPLTYTEPTINAEMPVVEPPDTDGVVAIALTVGDVLDRGMFRDKWRNGGYHERYVLRDMSGSATLPDGTQIGLTGCTFGEYSFMDRYSSRAGQKPGGKAPVNDLPTGALAIAPDDSADISTRGAAVPPEAPCVLTFDGESWEAPFGRTVWYAFDGTGGDVTLSTAGSGFDTVMGVYDATSMEQVSCVDDVYDYGWESLEAQVTLPTDEGTTYLVQVGGFAYDDPAGPEWGNLVLARS